ncbi:MAG: hypothetical protein QOE75_1754 [Solirubrobacterales bacterium]|jgi:hypothetical protein|nr:hypothetical protein [Solirubrobacterales bacterium]
MRRLLSIYARIGRVYWSWAPTLLLLAAIVFLPLGLLGALAAEVDVDSLELDSFIKVAALAGAITAITATSLLGEVFYSGAIAIGLTHPEHEHPPRLREIARQINYKRLIVIDILYVVLVLLGMVAFVIPGVLVFVYLGLAGPVVEIEERTVRQAFRRSFELVRGSFWFVFLVLAPIEIAGDLVGEYLGHFIHELFADSLLGTWLAETVSSSVLSPLFAVAVVLLTLELIERKDGEAPALKRRPAPIDPAVTA